MYSKLPITQTEIEFNAVVEKYGEFLRNTIIQICPKDLGLHFDDIEQEARLRLWRALQSERKIIDLASYIYRIAVTTTIDAIRRVKARREDQLCQVEEDRVEEGTVLSGAIKSDQTPDRVAERQILIDKVKASLNRLPVERRRAVGLYLEGLTIQEIADLLGWSEPKARNLLYRGLQELRQQLRAEGVEYEID
ncbi:MAG: RNA polymerase sigma factor [Acidobacteriota bacterium]